MKLNIKHNLLQVLKLLFSSIFYLAITILLWVAITKLLMILMPYFKVDISTLLSLVTLSSISLMLAIFTAIVIKRRLSRFKAKYQMIKKVNTQ